MLFFHLIENGVNEQILSGREASTAIDNVGNDDHVWDGKCQGQICQNCMSSFLMKAC